MQTDWAEQKHLVHLERECCVRSTSGLGPSPAEHQHLENGERKKYLQRLRRKGLRAGGKQKFYLLLVKKWFLMKPKRARKVRSIL